MPRQPYGDGRAYQHRNNDAGTPFNAMNVWKAMFDELYEESKSVATYVPFQIHCYISGRPGRAAALRSTIQHMKKEGVWITTAAEVASWTRDHVFKLDAAPRKIATA